MKAVFASALVAAATALPWEDSQYYSMAMPSSDIHSGVSWDVVVPVNSKTSGSVTFPSYWKIPYHMRRKGWARSWSVWQRRAIRDKFCSYFSVYRKNGEGSSAMEKNMLADRPSNAPDFARGPNVDQWDNSAETDDVQSATKSKFCKACFGGDDVQTIARFCKSCFGGDVEVQTKFCKACFGGDDVETTARFCKSCFGGDDAEVKARFCKSCFGGDVESTARFCKACFGGDDAEVKARFCKSCFGGDDAETTSRFCKSCFGGDDAEVNARFCKACFGGDDVATTVAFCKSCFGGDDAEVKARFCKSCFGGDVETHARFCKSCFGGDDAEVHSRFCKSCFGGDVQARVKCDCGKKADEGKDAGHYGIDLNLKKWEGGRSTWEELKYLISHYGYSVLAAAHDIGADPDACECALGTDPSTRDDHALAYEKGASLPGMDSKYQMYGGAMPYL